MPAINRVLAVAMLAAWTASAPAADAVDYPRDIKSLLKDRCFACHGVLKQKAGLRLDAASLIRKGSRSGPVVVPGDAGQSALIERISAADIKARMPPEGKKLTEKQIALLKTWIDQGARAPADDKPEEDPRTHWAFQKPVRPRLPAVQDSSWVRNPLDAFVAAEHEKRGLTPLGDAKPHVLLRRVYLDLIGLPPTRDELRDFLADPSPDAYEKAVEGLLESPQYGERWGRHWLDVWRYSDWYGRRAVPDVMNSYPRIWRWRDWIVRSLNEDKGYDRVLVEMLAADEVCPSDDANIVATGFLVRNWYKWNYNTWMKDTVEHTAKAFLGLTMNCAHCHDHKYDPITQEEYFKFRAFFEPLELRHERVAGEPDPGPFKKYVYAQSYGPIGSGAIRVFDEKLDAKTFMYTGGDERNLVGGKPPLEPGPPAALGGVCRIEPVALPFTAAYPGLKPFVQEEERAKRQKAVADARRAANSPLGKAALATAEAELKAIDARIAADKAKYGLAPGNANELARAAAKAERFAALCAAQEKLLQAEQKRENPGAAKAALAAAQKAYENPGNQYTPLSPTYPATSTGRRRALANWIANRDNPLTARVAVNHIWARHFGKPLVESTFNFGRSGKLPSHPELLDWLAVEFMDSGWSMKHIHRLMVTSTAYRMRSNLGTVEHPDRARDPDNRYLWRFNPARMEAEVVRDSLLHVAGELDLALGGQEIDHAVGQTSRRRSLYFTHHGEAKMEFLELFDAPNACDCYARSTSIMPQQALAMANSELTLRTARTLAERLWQQTPTKDATSEQAFIAAAFEQVLARPASAREMAASLAFLKRQHELLGGASAKPQAAGRARADLVQALFSHNDFVTIR